MCSKMVRRPWQTHSAVSPREDWIKRMFENGKVISRRCRTCRIPPITASA